MKVYRKGGDVLVAACDEDLLGQTFREGEIRITVGSFYEGERVTPEAFLRHLALATIGNFVGRITVRVAREGGYLDEGCELFIAGVPHAQMVRI
jgi:hypothetical protein